MEPGSLACKANALSFSNPRNYFFSDAHGSYMSQDLHAISAIIHFLGNNYLDIIISHFLFSNHH